MVEVNPFTETPDGSVVCVDAKVALDPTPYITITCFQSLHLHVSFSSPLQYRPLPSSPLLLSPILFLPSPPLFSLLTTPSPSNPLPFLTLASPLSRAQVNFDDNAEFRQKKIHDQRDTSQEDPLDVEAAKHDLNFINLDGNIACLVNGAGLAMATMDIIKLKGGEPANFLDLGGGVTTPAVVAAFKILDSDPKVQGILVNIFGGIVNCATVAQGIIDAAEAVWGGSPKVPLVVRLQGNNVEGAMKIMSSSSIKCILGDDLDDAAEKVVKAVSGK